MHNRLRRLLAAVLLSFATVAVALVGSAPAGADVLICEKFGSTSIAGGRYIVQNNVWGADTPQCINVTDTGFTITSANHNNATNGAPAAYPSVYAGCHYANCTTGNLPIQVSSLTSTSSSISYTYTSSGIYNASYDIWLDPTPRRDGQNGAEIMIWMNRQGPIQPVGSRIGTVTIEGRSWEVWYGNIGWHVISYVAPTAFSSFNFSPLAFINDVVGRGYITRSWYLTSVQAGFEPWQGGTGLAVNSFSFTANGGGGGGDTQAPSTPGQPSAGTVTSSSVALSWAGSTDNVGVTAYDVYRNGTLAGSTSGTSLTVSGLAAATAYTFTVRARDAAGNVSAASPGRTVTTAPGGGGGTGSCRVAFTQRDRWSTGYVADVTITNTGTSAVNGWALGFTFPGGQTLVNAWNATVSPNSGAVTARNVSWNGTLAPGGSVTFGVQVNHTGNGAAPTSFTLNGATCA